jgi:hypothetical protein
MAIQGVRTHRPGRREGHSIQPRHPGERWKGAELAAILGIENINSFRVQLSQWSHQGRINKIGPALYAPMPTST